MPANSEQNIYSASQNKPKSLFEPLNMPQYSPLLPPRIGACFFPKQQGEEFGRPIKLEIIQKILKAKTEILRMREKGFKAYRPIRKAVRSS
jgi:hypothetical protein